MIKQYTSNIQGGNIAGILAQNFGLFGTFGDFGTLGDIVAGVV